MSVVTLDLDSASVVDFDYASVVDFDFASVNSTINFSHSTGPRIRGGTTHHSVNVNSPRPLVDSKLAAMSLAETLLESLSFDDKG